MPIPSPIGDDACTLSRRWILDPSFAEDLVRLNRFSESGFGAEELRGLSLWIISGYRSAGVQAALNPDAPDSLHRRCPALAADLRLGGSELGFGTDEIWAILGGWWRLNTGGRWGGQFQDQTRFELNHFDHGVGA